MIVNKTLVPAFKKALLTAAAVVALMRCSEDEALLTPPVEAAASAENITAGPSEISISSLTISGINTAFGTAKDCKTCTYVVPEGATIIDGKELGFKPGSIICLNSIFKYGSLEFTNIEGSVEQPIVITTVGANLTDSPVESASATSDPY